MWKMGNSKNSEFCQPRSPGIDKVSICQTLRGPKMKIKKDNKKFELKHKTVWHIYFNCHPLIRLEVMPSSFDAIFKFKPKAQHLA